jgi:hypothetical protein
MNSDDDGDIAVRVRTNAGTGDKVSGKNSISNAARPINTCVSLVFSIPMRFASEEVSVSVRVGS